MSAIAVIVGQILVIWIMVTGFAYIVRGPRGATALNRWALRSMVRVTRRIIGGLLVAIGNTI
jgi:threonine/homoserine/homoserine lactone efflux protein